MLSQGISLKTTTKQTVQNETRLVILEFKLGLEVGLSEIEPFLSSIPLQASTVLRIQEYFIP